VAAGVSLDEARNGTRGRPSASGGGGAAVRFFPIARTPVEALGDQDARIDPPHHAAPGRSPVVITQPGSRTRADRGARATSTGSKS
jgi:hypothetical protein